jgi:secreted trypsin-like serine protease
MAGRSLGWRVAALAALGLAAGWAGLPAARAIKGDSVTEAKDHPEALLITGRDTRTGKQGRGCGVLIAPRAVLTAGHNANGFDAWEVTAPYARPSPLTATVREARVDPDREPGHLEHDLAVLILDKPLDVGRPPPELSDGELLPFETKLEVVGRVQNGVALKSQLVRTMTTLVAFPGNVNVYGGHPQAGEPGDSGGPVYVVGKGNTLVGVVLGGIGFSRANVPKDVYVPVSRHNRDWILKQLPK